MSRTRIKYIENKSGGVPGLSVIGRVHLSKSGRTLTYRGMTLERHKGVAVMANYRDVETGGQYWVSGPRKDQKDRLTGDSRAVHIDADVAADYVAWLKS